MTLTSNSRRKIVIVGGNSAGLRVANQIFRMMRWPNVTIVEPSTSHVYEPLLPWLAAGLATSEEVSKPLADVLPKQINWARQGLKKLDPKKKVVILESGREIPFEFLVWADGLVPNWKKSMKGVDALVGENGICHTLDLENARATQKMVNSFEGGKVVFAMMSQLKGEEAAQRFLFLLDDVLRKKGLRDKSSFHFVTIRSDLFPSAKIREKLEAIAKQKGVELHFNHGFKSIDADKRTIVFDQLNEKGKASGETLELDYDLLHVTPDLIPPEPLNKAKLAARTGDNKGLMAVDQHTLQHKKQKYYFGIGDALAIPIPRVDAAAESQAPIVAYNLLATLKGKGPGTFKKYDGHASVSLSSANKQALLTGFDYENEQVAVSMGSEEEGYLSWLMSRYINPWMYWRKAAKGQL